MAGAANAPFAAPAAAALPGTGGGLLRVVLALLLVLGAVLAAAWCSRRLRGLSGGHSAGSLEVLTQVTLGSRERAVLLRVGTRRLLVGVAAGSVRTLHVLDDAQESAIDPSPPAAAGADARPSFKALLLRSLGK
jgi:flagellar protein FliO/FliZ